MKNKHLLLVFFFLSGFLLPVYSIPENIYKKISMQEGLADNSIYSIQKDQDGFIWFGTGYGLSRYDGKIIRNFIPETYSNITHLYDTSGGMLLFIANNKLNVFNRYTEDFVEVRDWKGEEYYTEGIYILNDSLFWSVSKNELHLLKRAILEKKKERAASYSLQLIKKYKLTQDKEYLNNICLSPDKKTIYLTTTHCRLLAFNCKAMKCKLIQHFQYKEQYPIVPTSLIFENGYLWISFLGKGVIQYDILRNSYEQYSNPPYQKTFLSHNDVYDLVAINNRNLLAATWDGYTVFSPSSNDKSNRYSTVIVDKTGYPSYHLETRIISVYYDPEGIIYMGTRGGGVFISNIKEKYYHKILQKRNNEINGIIADDQNRIWLGTFSGEILRSKFPFDSHQKIEFESVRSPQSKGEYAVLCACKDDKGNLWFGRSDFSISCYNVEKKDFIDYPIPAGFKSTGNSKSSYVWSLFIDTKGHFLIGLDKGFLIFNPRTGQFFAPQSDKTITAVRAITQGKDDTIWLGTSDGLYSLQLTDPNKVLLRNGYEYQGNIKGRYIRSLLASSDGSLYIGYTTGLGILKGDTIKKFYSRKDGLCSNFIDCMTEDAKGRVWLGTTSGISCYNKYQQLFFNYYISENNKSATAIGKTLFWGNNNALTYLDPDNIASISKLQKPVLVDLELRNQRIEPGEMINGQIILEKGLPYTKEIMLKHANRDFSLTFRTLAYGERTQKYNYRLLPYQKEWLVCDDNGKASYTNLPAGKYIFEVKSIYPEGSDSASSTLNITILPHWSEAWWMRLGMYLFLILIISLSIQRYRKKQKRIQYQLKLEHELDISNIERNNERRLREEREAFFVNTAHELRTPITLLLSPLYSLLSKKKNSDKEYQTLAMMLENGNSLQRLVDDLLYVQKIEVGMVKLKISEVNIVAIVKDVCTYFRQLAEAKELDFRMESTQDNCMVWIDIEKIVSAIRNLLSNAFKYTPQGGRITLSVSETEIDSKEFCKITVRDNGVGIPEELQKHIFDSFTTGNIQPTFSTQIGIGLYIVKKMVNMHHGSVTLESETQKGSAFTLLLPKGYEHFTDDEYEIITEPAKCLTEEKTVVQDNRKEEELLYTTYKKHKLLIIEDNSDIRKYIAGIFPKQQYTIFEAGNGQEGIKLAKENVPGLIISDVMMPVKDGFECCREIRADQEIAHIPIIMLTAKVEDTDKIKSIQLGVDDYIIKPFNPELLKARVENLLLYREQLKRLYTKTLLLKENPPAEEEQEDTFMQQIINIIEANLTNDSFGVKMLADELNISPPTLYRKIKQRSDLSIKNIIRSVRMSKAASLLMEGKYSIVEVSILVGFTDPNTFRKHFIEQFGVPPSKYI